MEKMIVLIPAYKPEEKMLGLLEALLQYRGASADSRQDGEQAGSEDRARAGLAKEENTRIDGIVVVDDGGGDPFRALFDRAQELGCLVVRHEENRGKGAAHIADVLAGVRYPAGGVPLPFRGFPLGRRTRCLAPVIFQQKMYPYAVCWETGSRLCFSVFLQAGAAEIRRPACAAFLHHLCSSLSVQRETDMNMR